MIGREHEEEYCCLLRPYLSPNFLLSCQGKFPEPKILIEFQEEVFGSSTQITRNGSDNMKIYVGGNKQDYLINDLNKVSNEINTLTQNGFQIRTVTDSSLANYYVFLGRRKSYGELFPSSKSLVTTN
jgi:hypothetical protein